MAHIGSPQALKWQLLAVTDAPKRLLSVNVILSQYRAQERHCTTGEVAAKQVKCTYL